MIGASPAIDLHSVHHSNATIRELHATEQQFQGGPVASTEAPSGHSGSEGIPLEVSHLDVTLGASDILHDVSLTVHSGETVALMGANGSGKSTLVRACLGIIPVTSGTVRLFGKELDRPNGVEWDRLGYVPQRVTAASGVPATALEVVRSGLLGPKRLWADRGRKARAAAMEALASVDLADRANDHVQVFSGGQSQRVLIARALVRHPDLLVLDEPLAGIDHDSREALATILGRLHEQGITIVSVLHEMGELESLVERAVVLRDGRVAHDGEPPRPEPGHDAPGHDHVHPHKSPEPGPHHAPVLRTELS